MSREFLYHEVMEDRRHPGDFRVEAIDSEADGEIYVAIFSGPDAAVRAEEYANWKNASQKSVGRHLHMAEVG